MIGLLAALACAPPEAEPGSDITLPDDLEVPWSEAFIERDGIGEVFPIDVLVTGPGGAATPGVRVGITAAWDGASLHPVDDPGARELVVWDLGSGGARALRACVTDTSPTCTYVEAITGADGRVLIDAFIDVAPHSGASVAFFAQSGEAMASVEFGFLDPELAGSPVIPSSMRGR
ncbi:MAG: hypothetical protein FJ090_10320 [Deltaproteobacteria bacterium]|nr:hypothetical protein [Deltaproteobacteria bacterium]